MNAPDAEAWIRFLKLEPHPEGGFFRQTYRAAALIPGHALDGFPEPRAASTAILYLLRAGDRSRFHRLAADEVWHHHAGGPARIHRITPSGDHVQQLLGADPANGALPQRIVPHGDWFGVEVDPAADYVLAGCTVAPGFEYADFELADREALTATYPGHAALIARLT